MKAQMCSCGKFFKRIPTDECCPACFESELAGRFVTSDGENVKPDQHEGREPIPEVDGEWISWSKQ